MTPPTKLKSREELLEIVEEFGRAFELTIGETELRWALSVLQQLQEETVKCCAEIAGQDAILQPSNDAWQLLIRRKEAILALLPEIQPQPEGKKED